MSKKAILLNLIASLLVVCAFMPFYPWFYQHIAMSMTLTGNGIWKATGILEYINGTGNLEYGDILYYPTVKFIYEHWELHSGYNTYDLIVLFNGFCASLLSGIIFFFSQLIFKRLHISILLCFFHFLLPGVFYLSVSNEDIFPSYTLFVIGAFTFFFYLKERKLTYLLLSSLFFSLSMLYHWTSGVPAFGALFTYLLVFDKIDLRQRFWNAVYVFAVPSILFAFVSFGFDIFYPSIWFPGKGGNSLWISGVLLKKIPIVLYNTSSFFFTGSITKYFRFDAFSYIRPFIIQFFVLIVLFQYLKTKYSNRALPIHFRFLFFLFLVFGLGTAMNFYEQGSDPQFFIQPQFFIFFAFALFIRFANWKRLLFFILPIFLVIGINSYEYIESQKGRDKLFWSNVTAVEKAISSPEKAVFIGRGFQNFNSLAALKWGGYDKLQFIHFPEGMPWELELTDDEYVALAKKKIYAYEEKGYDLVVIDFIYKDPVNIGNSFYGFDFTSKIIDIQSFILSSFDIEKVPGTYHYNFYLICPKESSN